MHHTLEGSHLFPYVAWTVVISFAIFTFMLVMRLNEDVNRLDQRFEAQGLSYETAGL